MKKNTPPLKISKAHVLKTHTSNHIKFGGHSSSHLELYNDRKIDKKRSLVNCELCNDVNVEEKEM